MPKKQWSGMLVPITSVRAGRGRKLFVTWADGYEATVDVGRLISRFATYAPLDDDARFRAARVGEEHWTVDFGSDLEITTDTLRRLALEQDGEIMSPESFHRWRAKHRLSLAAAAKALGVSERTVMYYSKGERVIPKTVRLACVGYEVESRSR